MGTEKKGMVIRSLKQFHRAVKESGENGLVAQTLGHSDNCKICLKRAEGIAQSLAQSHNQHWSAFTMAVQGAYIAWRIRNTVLPFLRVYGQWVEEHIVPLAAQRSTMADAVQQQAYDELMSRPVWGEDYSGEGSEEAEDAFDIGLSFYENITAMYQGTLNLFAAGLFHVIEQQLAHLTRSNLIEQ
jgi:hypothetical protein